MSVVIREKKLDNGMISLYLDIYHNHQRKYEFLNIHIPQKRLSKEDKEKKELAEKIRSQREYELIVQNNNLYDKKKAKADYVAYLETLKDRRKSFRDLLYNLKLYLNDAPLPFEKINAKWLLDFQQHLIDKLKHNSAWSYLTTMKTSFNIAEEEKIVVKNPFNEIPKAKRIRYKEVKHTHLELHELETLLNCSTRKIHPQVKQAYTLSAFSGLRWSDTHQLLWKEVVVKKINEKETYLIHFEQEKTEGVEYMPLSEQATQIIKARKQQAEEDKDNSPYVFPQIKEKNEGLRANYSWVNRQLKSWAEQAKIDKNITFHTARHTFAIMSLDHGADLYTVSKLLGHKDIKTTSIYAKVSDRLKDKAVASLPTINISAKVA